MHVNEESHYTIFLSGSELGQIRVELALLSDEADIDWTKYPHLDRLTDALIHTETGTEM